MKKFLIIFCAILIMLPQNCYAEDIKNQSTGRVLLHADVPDWYGEEITIIYQNSTSDGYEYEFKLNRSNGYAVQRMMKEGNYSCIKRDAKYSKITVEESIGVWGEKEVLVSVLPDKSKNVQVINSKGVEYKEVERKSYAPLVAVGLSLVAIILIVILFRGKVR